MTRTPSTVPPRVLDVSKLSEGGFDTRSPLWWGNTLLMCIETTTIALMVVTYFYIRRNFEQWPPPRVDQMPYLLKPLPRLGPGTWNLAVLLASVVPMVITEIAARKIKHTAV